MGHRLTEADEAPHAQTGDISPLWQENFFIICWGVEADCGLMIHCKRQPRLGTLTARIVARIGGDVVSRKVVEPLRSSFSVDGLSLDIVRPYEDLRLSGRFMGTRGFGPLGFVAWRDGGEASVTLDIRMRSRLAPADFADGFEEMAARAARASGAKDAPFKHTQEHYEQGGLCDGFIEIEEERRAFQGLFVRDHTWGERDERGMSKAGYGFWTASVTEDGACFFNATGMKTAAGVIGVGVVVDRDGQSTTTDIDVTFLAEPGLRTFEATRISIGGAKPVLAEGRAIVHLVKYLPGSGPGRFDDNAMSTFKSGVGRGFGVHEYAGTLTPEQIAIMDAAET